MYTCVCVCVCTVKYYSAINTHTHTHTEEHYAAIKKKEILCDSVDESGGVLLSEVSQEEKESCPFERSRSPSSCLQGPPPLV